MISAIKVIFLFIGEMYRAAKKHWRIAVPVALLCIVALFAIISRACWTDHEINKTGEQVTETKVEEGKTADNSSVASGNADNSTKDAQTASKASQTAIQKARDARNANVKNVSADELHQAHCAAYPEDCK